MLNPFLPPKRSPAPPSAPDQGLTLIECLVAIVMVALVAGSIAPVMVISVASRVNSQKAEQALGLAQAEIERTRSLVEQGVYATANLPPIGSTASSAVKENEDISSVLGPNLSVTNSTNFAFTVPVDVNGDGTNDFRVQRFRSAGYTPASASTPIAFNMGVRVYDISATGTGNLPTDVASIGLTSGTGERSQRPLAALYTTIAVGDQDDSLCDLIRYFNSTQTSPSAATDLTLPPTCVAP
ncbi:type II secretion system protein [Phormidium sp. FACHB-1136]|uniref:type IV pilus modification PilV family protein n=1 Tax=Phormidium sp. FACHB-1136 TaxID=2692848 RepID=UPI001683E9A8|nr:type II secretion system protein [Phormidium sp. FACHB-1136]MBD2428803.1 type II secretion system protein [Phormidium sp. FACHB-1136]